MWVGERQGANRTSSHFERAAQLQALQLQQCGAPNACGKRVCMQHGGLAGRHFRHAESTREAGKAQTWRTGIAAMRAHARRTPSATVAASGWPPPVVRSSCFRLLRQRTSSKTPPMAASSMHARCAGPSKCQGGSRAVIGGEQGSRRASLQSAIINQQIRSDRDGSGGGRTV